MNKYIRSIGATDEPVSLGVIEPLDGSFQTFHEGPSFCTSFDGGPKDVPALLIGCILVARKVGCQENVSKTGGANRVREIACNKSDRACNKPRVPRSSVIALARCLRDQSRTHQPPRRTKGTISKNPSRNFVSFVVDDLPPQNPHNLPLL